MPERTVVTSMERSTTRATALVVTPAMLALNLFMNFLRFSGVAPLLFVFWWLGGMAFCRQANSKNVV
jgi:hypothetical protein